MDLNDLAKFVTAKKLIADGVPSASIAVLQETGAIESLAISDGDENPDTIY
jgi:hypothetical protein